MNIRMTAGWHMTDIFAQDATSQPQHSWSNIDTTLWLLAFSGQSQSLQILFQSLSYF